MGAGGRGGEFSGKLAQGLTLSLGKLGERGPGATLAGPTVFPWPGSLYWGVGGEFFQRTH